MSAESAPSDAAIAAACSRVVIRSMSACTRTVTPASAPRPCNRGRSVLFVPQATTAGGCARHTAPTSGRARYTAACIGVSSGTSPPPGGGAAESSTRMRSSVPAVAKGRVEVMRNPSPQRDETWPKASARPAVSIIRAVAATRCRAVRSSIGSASLGRVGGLDQPGGEPGPLRQLPRQGSGGGPNRPEIDARQLATPHDVPTGNPDLADLLTREAIDDGLQWVMDGGGGDRLPADQDEVGLLADLDGADGGGEAEGFRPTERRHAEGGRGIDDRGIEVVDPLQQCRGLEGLGHVLRVVAGGPVHAEPDGNAG